MNIKITAKLTKAEIGEAIKAYLLERGLKVVGNMVFLHGTRLEGYGMAERNEPYFDGVSVDCEQITK